MREHQCQLTFDDQPVPNFRNLLSGPIHCQEAMDLEPLSFLATQEIFSVP